MALECAGTMLANLCRPVFFASDKALPTPITRSCDRRNRATGAGAKSIRSSWILPESEECFAAPCCRYLQTFGIDYGCSPRRVAGRPPNTVLYDSAMLWALQ